MTARVVVWLAQGGRDGTSHGLRRRCHVERSRHAATLGNAVFAQHLRGSDSAIGSASCVDNGHCEEHANCGEATARSSDMSEAQQTCWAECTFCNADHTASALVLSFALAAWPYFSAAVACALREAARPPARSGRPVPTIDVCARRLPRFQPSGGVSSHTVGASGVGLSPPLDPLLI